MSLLPTATVATIARYVGQRVTLAGWVYHKTEKGKLIFILLRDGSGTIQCVTFKKNVSEETFATAQSLTQESSCRITGSVRADERAPGGYELDVESIELIGPSHEYPITPKEHGVEFLMAHRHLWVRSAKQHAILRIRAEVIAAAQEWLNEQGFVRFDTPILTATAAEGTTNLFATDYFDLGKAYLAQTGQLYVEAGMMAFGKVYCFGPTFRAEKSKTRRHLTEFWMIEPEVAFADHEDNMRLQEEFVSAIVARVLERRRDDLQTLERDTTLLEQVRPPFPRITYDEAIELIAAHQGEVEGADPLPWGEDFGAPHETLIASKFDRPVFVERFPSAVKAFYMQPDPERPEVALCADLLAPEGYGEIIGGSQRIHDPILLEQRIREHGLRIEDYEWYLDLRRYGTVPHSGFGMGIERVVAWITGTRHIRETIPFPRQLYRIYP
ncbi:MAG TPA: asparagine--tRNA ligase [Chloroflexus aurantiacus]|jgi:asparaginyl-tRNA synthetase|uniref:Asparagine--tRNA ligase n=2 Tax=Chloroflexus aurantiacus TaxID=1108 RepID=SYN_CHLAA|nr:MULTISPECIES: asparagine--tRNA ligase [Chloroflexus]A9WA97.1 RecName: Full=Asparagine--tRNA ligase; AltName: Full=Asparaginyl-tRNA synthetase; Short=AsnRS [Chloroflexus aurantiacus J-10-fl]B9LCU8.1 RecName: Full=Asparagine--tRNA ligase; AltName: Full=Asparaginyl-tRNA synthetase; Short=AsnRS [Chloroflexus aurantiacus Y-400-fl]RMG52939.1 MAG: asparagine--tRNA ligase [Chloroflexota bacterium]ABY34656.1 asparaginyl-tRNA synthetase [Chloroflexus aurantiacus J-10-fl]HBW67384.1 asparagine--tRNA li